MTIHIAGLGPGRAELLTVEVGTLLASGVRVILRTRHHPTLSEIDPGASFDDCDDLYREGASFDQVYDAIVARVIEAGRAGDVRDSQADITKARTLLGYQPIVPLEEGLRHTLDWCRSERPAPAKP